MQKFILTALALYCTLDVVTPYFYDARDSSSAYVDNRSTHVTYIKDGNNCYRQVVRVINGQQQVERTMIDCKEAERLIKEEQERTQKLHQQMNHQMNQQFNKVHQDIANTQNSIWSSLRKGFGGFNFRF